VYITVYLGDMETEREKEDRDCIQRLYSETVFKDCIQRLYSKSNMVYGTLCRS
jgi:hypothetical protein